MKLRSELVLFMLISLVISFTAAFVIRNFGIGISQVDEKARENKIYAECLTSLEEKLRNCELENTQLVQQMLGDYEHLVGYSFYVTDDNGKIIATTDNQVNSINKLQLVDGKRSYSVSKKDHNIYRLYGCDQLKDGYYLCYDYLMYDTNDTGMVLGALVGALIIFFILIWGRISYLSEIRDGVGEIEKGNLGYRVNCKYSNDLRELAEGINQMAHCLEKEEKKKNEFLTNIAHDVRTPLTTILGYLNMIQKEKYDSKEELMHYIGIMERKGSFLAEMLEDFFQYAKLSSGDIVLQKSDFELNELLRQLYEEEEEDFREHGLTLELVLFSESIASVGDIQLLVRVVGNLLSNALKYSRPNTSVMIKSEQMIIEKKQYSAFSVSNVPKEEITQGEIQCLCDRLYKKDASRSEEGSGLGLSIAKNIMQLHGGNLEIKRVGEQLVFSAYFEGSR